MDYKGKSFLHRNTTILHEAVTDEKTIIIFGAGKIGRSFIGQLFGCSGYQVVFVDVDSTLINELNRRRSYPVVVKGETDEVIIVSQVRAVSAHDRDAVKKEMARASVMAVSVGQSALAKLLPLIAEGLVYRQACSPGRPLDIIIAENMRSAAEYLRSAIKPLLPRSYPFERLVGLVETSIGKMVPIMTREELENDPLQVFAEPYNTLILDKLGFKGPIPQIGGLDLKENMKAWVDRKAFIHNLGHATAAYAGYFFHPKACLMYEVLADKALLEFTRKTMVQSAKILFNCYPADFSMHDLEVHINDLLNRFQNRALKDTVFRVGRDLPRKLGVDDRFAGIINMARKKKLEYSQIMEAMTYGLFFRKTDETGRLYFQDKLFLKSLKENGVKMTLQALCKFHPESDRELADEINNLYQKLLHQAKPG